jgi:hypothetical protein
MTTLRDPFVLDGRARIRSKLPIARQHTPSEYSLLLFLRNDRTYLVSGRNFEEALQLGCDCCLCRDAYFLTCWVEVNTW